jgi:tetratricopeptide (TPR) repeat protein
LRKQLYILIIAFFSIGNSFAQVDDMDKKLAMQYYSDGDYEKAAMYLDKIYEEAPTYSNYTYYFNTLLELEETKIAEKICKKQMKADPNELRLFLDMAKVYGKTEKEAKMAEEYDNAINSINDKTRHTAIINLANAFQLEGMLDRSILVYQQGNKFSNSSNLMYNRSIAQIYGVQGKMQLMFTTLLDLVHNNEGYLVSVQSSIANSIDFSQDEKHVDLLKMELLKRIQKNPNKSVYNELLAWVFTQKGDFNSAFIQIKSIDKKENEKGRRVLELANTSVNNSKFDIAIKCYDYVISLGDNQPNYRTAKIRRLNTLKQKLISGDSPTNDELNSLKDNYIESIQQIGRNEFAISSIRDLASLYAYYIHDIDAAQNLLEDALTFGGLRKKKIAEIKIELADILVIKGDVWDASLLYMQVDKGFKHDRIGHLAKFKNTKIFYYTGDFDWAQGELDVLKASTSKLIANDAMELSMLITDNYNMDTTQVTMQRFAKADLLIFQNKTDQANLIFDSINTEFTYHTLNDEILIKRAEIEIKKGNYEKAVIYLLEIVTTYGDDLLADNALYTLAGIYEKNLHDTDKAAEFYKKILFEHTDSLFVIEARKKFRELTKGTQKFGNDGETIKIESID